MLTREEHSAILRRIFEAGGIRERMEQVKGLDGVESYWGPIVVDENYGFRTEEELSDIQLVSRLIARYNTTARTVGWELFPVPFPVEEKSRIGDKTHSPPLERAVIADRLGIARSVLSGRSKFAAFIKTCEEEQGTSTPRLPWGEFHSHACTAVRRSKRVEADEMYDAVRQFDEFREVFS